MINALAGGGDRRVNLHVPQIDAGAAPPRTPHLRKVCLGGGKYPVSGGRRPRCGSVSLRRMLLVDLKRVRLFPSLMVPPICPGLCSGMSITCGQSRNSQTALRSGSKVSLGQTYHRVLRFRVELR